MRELNECVREAKSWKMTSEDLLNRSMLVSLMYLYAPFERAEDVATHVIQEVRQDSAARYRQEGAKDRERDAPRWKRDLRIYLRHYG